MTNEEKLQGLAKSVRPKILLVGDIEGESAPLRTWKAALERTGCSCIYVDLAALSMSSLLGQLLKSHCIVYQWYGLTSPFLFRQFAVAAVIGRPLIRKWSGTDVYRALNESAVLENVKTLDALTSLNLTSEHEGIVQELKEIGIDATLTAQVLCDPIDDVVVTQEDFGNKVLIYMPTTRYEFYHRDLMEKVIQMNSDINFIVVADEHHSLIGEPNVDSRGWVHDMRDVWNEVGAILRITRHDGFSRSVVEALFRARYVIHNQKLPGVWYAETLGEITSALDHFSRLNEPNFSGQFSLRAYLGPDPERALRELIVGQRVSVKTRVAALGALARSFCVSFLRFNSRAN